MRHRVKVVLGDITKQALDAIVNAANSSLLSGGGVDGAIHRAAGPQLVWDCRKLQGCPPGKAKITKGHYLPAKHVIHAVGPIWQGGDRGEDELLTATYRSVFELVESHAIATVAFPAISTGAYRFPLERAARIALSETRAFLERNHSVQQIVFCCFESATSDLYKRLVQELIPGTEAPAS